MTEREEILAARDGDAEAASRLFARYWRLVRTWLSGYTADRDRAEDLTQQTFLRAWQKLPQLRDPDRFLPWIRRVARTAALARKRPVEVSLARPVAATESTASAAVRAERDARVERVLDRLKPTDRSLLALCYTEELPLASVSRLLDVPVTTLRRRRDQAVERFRSAWVSEGGNHADG